MTWIAASLALREQALRLAERVSRFHLTDKGAGEIATRPAIAGPRDQRLGLQELAAR